MMLKHMNNVIAICTYRVKQNHEDQFLGLLRKHSPTLSRLGLLTNDPSPMFQGTDESGRSFFVEILHWKSADGHKVAEQTPEVLAIWEKMGQLVETRLGRPAMEFPIVEQIER